MTQIADWPIRLSITEDGDRTVAMTVLTTRDNTLSAEGVALRNPHAAGIDIAASAAGIDIAASAAGIDIAASAAGMVVRSH
jgi:hypothetical protein